MANAVEENRDLAFTKDLEGHYGFLREGHATESITLKAGTIRVFERNVKHDEWSGNSLAEQHTTPPLDRQCANVVQGKSSQYLQFG